MSEVPKRIAANLINALKGGVVPRVGLEYVTVGRAREITAILNDLKLVEDGGAAFRFIVGKYGSGKSFLLQTIRNHATARGFVVADADLSPERRFAGTKGQGLATYRELMRNLSTKAKPDGGALPLLLEKWLSGMQAGEDAHRRIAEIAMSLTGMVNGFEFAKAINAYWRAHLDGDDGRKASALKWFRGESAGRREAREELGINFTVTDETWYDFLKIMAAFFVSAGYKGLLVFVDELVNISKIPFSVTRANNYEKILTMYNDALQGKAGHIGFMMGGTPQCMEDRHRGVFSYEALRSRLAEGHFAGDGLRDLQAPIIRLEMLSQEEVYVLLEKLQGIYAGLHGCRPPLGREELLYFITVEYNRVGAGSHITPREIIRDFIELISILHQNPQKNAAEVLGDNSFAHARPDGGPESGAFAEFEI